MARRERTGSVNNRPRRDMPWGDLPRGLREAIDGVILIDKPQGVTSHDIVGALRRLGATRKVGHTGTLDPLATGLLTVAFGRATKLVQYLTGHDKAYEARFVLGVGTDSHDADGQFAMPSDGQRERLSAITADSVDTGIAELTGTIKQVPPIVSAKKIGGKRAHDLNRDGHVVELAEQTVHVPFFQRVTDVGHTFTTIDGEAIETLTFNVVVEVSSGTYIRSLVRDLGEKLGVPAHLTALRRTRVGHWNVADAVTIEALAESISAGADLPIVRLDDVCAQVFSRIDITEAEAAALSYGQFIEKREPQRTDGAKKWPAAAFSSDGRAVALLSPRSGKLKPDLQLLTKD